MDRRQFIKGAGILVASSMAAWKPVAAQVPSWKGLRVGIISDEVDKDFENALKWVKEQGIEWVELRNLWGTYVTDLRESEVSRARELLVRYGIQVSNIATPFLKVTLPGTHPIPNDQMLERFGNYSYGEHDALLQRAFEKAKAFGANKVRIFSFWRVPRPGRIFDRVKSRLVDAVGMAERAGMLLMLENESACNVGTGSELAAIMKEIPSKHLRGLWDPGNSFTAGERPYPDGYEKLDKGRIEHIHLKDAFRDDATKKRVWVPIGRGEIDIKGQLAALIRDKYSGVISVETHYVPERGTPADGSLESVNGLRRILLSL